MERHKRHTHDPPKKPQENADQSSKEKIFPQKTVKKVIPLKGEKGALENRPQFST